jgi:hypothetical protein
VRQLPAQHARAQLARAIQRGRRRDPRALGVEVVARAETDQDPAPPGGVRVRQRAEVRARLAGVDERLQRTAGDVVRDPLAVEDADDDGVGAGVGRVVRGGPDLDRRRLSSVPCPRP